MKRLFLLLLLSPIGAAAADAPEILEFLPANREILYSLTPPQQPCQSTPDVAVICWNASPSPAAAIAGYNIYRAPAATDCPGPGTDLPACVKVNPAPVTTLAFADPAGIGRWFYFVRSVAVSGAIESVNSTVITPLPPGSTATALMVILRPGAASQVRIAP